MRVDVTLNRTHFREVENALAGIKNGYKLAMVKALNHTAQEERKEVKDQIYRDLKLGKRFINNKLAVKKARYGSLRSSVEAPGKGLQLGRYGAKKLDRGGVSVEVKRGGGRKKLPGAFLVTYKNGTKAVYMRTGPGKWSTFEGTRELYGPSVSQAFGTEQEKLVPPAGNRLMKRMAYEADELLRRQKAGLL